MRLIDLKLLRIIEEIKVRKRMKLILIKTYKSKINLYFRG
ncbi:MAG: hypothetical protein ACI93S_000177 [Ancylomarina sp.]|jgi:hypothetical protein